MPVQITGILLCMILAELFISRRVEVVTMCSLLMLSFRLYNASFGYPASVSFPRSLPDDGVML